VSPSSSAESLIGTASSLPDRVGILIVGSGFARLGAAIRLERSGRSDYLVIERGADVGGTWRDNTYPGAACDVPSHLYSYSFALNPDWTHAYSGQPEIWRYLRRTAERSGTLDRHVFGCEMLTATWDQAAAEWVVRTTSGSVRCSILVTAFGGLCEPRMPSIAGIDGFTGPIFHTSRWDNTVDLSGKRVAVIGTGASAVQLIPEIASVVKNLTVYQRTAPWIMPRSNRSYRQWVLRRLPGVLPLRRAVIFGRLDITSAAFCFAPRLLGIASFQARRHLHRQVPVGDLRARLTPTFRLGCKRILFSNVYYPALLRDNVELVSEGIAEVRGHMVVADSGTTREHDVLIVATGFQVTDNPAADRIIDADGISLGERWRASGPQAYKGTTVNGFPNLFMLVGPNVGTGNMSMVYMIESQLNYLLDALRVMQRHGLAAVEVRQQPQQRFNEVLQRRLARSVWSTGCSSWYQDARGRNAAIWPNFAVAFRAATRRFDLHAYRVTPAEAVRDGGSARRPGAASARMAQRR
jgi:cation diffusion facilitator CzcD-associated flavoprotein CzcO